MNLKNSSNSEVHYACCCALAFLAVRQDVRAALYESTVGPLMEALDLFVRRSRSAVLVFSGGNFLRSPSCILFRRLEATDHPGLRYAICAIATELAKSEAGKCSFHSRIP
jgi:hypothetical protein